MSADQVAEAVAKFRAGNWQLPDVDQSLAEAALGLHGLATRGPIVDLTAISNELVHTKTEINLYEDHPCISPPWDDAIFAWVGQSGRVRLVAMSAADRTIEADEDAARWEPHPDSDFDWDSDVRWVLTLGLWLDVGLRYRSSPDSIQARVLSGPAHGWLIAVGHQGDPLDIHWIDLPHDDLVIGDANGPVTPDNDAQFQFMQTSLVHVLQALNFLNCSNVDIVEPKRPRSERRRIERTGVHVHELTVYPKGSSTRSRDGGPAEGGSPMHSVRGHFSEYGPKYGKGLLFGKYEGRFWIPQHARGSSEHGVDVHDYKLVEPQ